MYGHLFDSGEESRNISARRPSEDIKPVTALNGNWWKCTARHRKEEGVRRIGILSLVNYAMLYAN